LTGLVLLDLDGTLIDPVRGLSASYSYTCAELELEMLEPDEMGTLIGPPLQEALRIGWGLEEPLCSRAVEIFRSHYGAEALLQYDVYDGVGELLQELAPRARLAVATSKPEPYAARIIDREGWADHFAVVAGATLDGSRRTKAEVIGAVLGVTVERPAVMVGDRAADVVGAAAHDLPTVGVTWGYGSATELMDAGAAALASTPAEACAAVLRLLSR
jgi:phosphoglycolate phosphatase